MQKIHLGNIIIDVEQKDIKNIHLKIYPPFGKVKISAPRKTDLATLCVFAISKLSWIKEQQEKLKNQNREASRKYVTGENHYFTGKQYFLKVVEQDAKPQVILKQDRIELYIKPNTTITQRKQILDEWYRTELKKIVPKMIAEWEKKIGVKCYEFHIKKMRTKWGTCNIEAKRIWLNLELAKKPIECLEYVVVHELVHLLERRHSKKFMSLMDKFMPKWRFYKEELNKLPLMI